MSMTKNPNPPLAQADQQERGDAYQFPALPAGAADGQAAATITKAELVEVLFEQMGLNKREAKDMVDSFFGHIRSALENGQEVKLSGFGNFQLRDKPQRPGRNPKTGEEIAICARRVVTFHASQKLKALVGMETAQALMRMNGHKPAGQ